LTVKFDVRNAVSTSQPVTISIASANVTSENTLGDDIRATGSATGEQMNVKKSGAAITLVSKSSAVSKTTDTSGNATTTLSATFVINVKASGQDVVMGTVASTTAPFATTSSFTVYKNGVDQATTTYNAPMVVSFATPSDGVTVSGSSFTLADGNDVNVTVVAKILVSGTASNNDYAIQVKNILGSTFMASQSSWRTDATVLP